MVTSSTANNSVLEQLSFNHNDDILVLEEDPTTTTTANTTNNIMQPSPQSNNNDMQGVLWKRRDVFKNRWRPRWFVLHPEQKILTYYLLVNNSSAPIISSSSSSSPTAAAATTAAATTTTTTTSNNTSSSSNNYYNNRQRTYSDTSDLSTSTDYDVVPRGTIYIGGSQCSVDANNILTRPTENLFALTISDKENATQCHLAARTPTARQRWIEQLRRVIGASSSSSSSPLSLSPLQSTITQQHHRQQQQQRGGGGGSSSFEPVHEETIASDTSNDDANDNNNDSSDNSPSEVPPTIPPTPTTMDMPASLSSTTSSSQWKTVSSPNLTDNVPSDLANEIDLIINRFFSIHRFDVKNNNPEWIVISNTKDEIHSSSHARNPSMIRSIYQSKSNHPIDYLQFGWDVSRATEISTNIRFQKQIKSYNQHTCLVHTSHHRVWPTAAREFTSVAHWRLLENNQGQRGICVVAFSCKQADELRPILPHTVRGTLHVSINFYRPILQGGGGCTHTRVISFDLNGNIPKTIVQTLIQQQRGLPKVMDSHIKRTKTATTTNSSSTDIMEYDAIYAILNKQPTTTTRAAIPVVAHSHDDDDDVDDDEAPPPIPKKVVYDRRVDSIVTPPSMTLYWIEHPPLPGVWKEATRLLAPVAIYKILWSIDFRFDYIIFVIGLIIAIRWIVLQHLLQHYGLLPRVQRPLLRSSSEESSNHRATTLCQFSVDLQGVLRYLQEEEAAATNDQQCWWSAASKIKLEHVILRALAQAMAQQPGLVARQYPFLPPLYSMDVLIQDEKLTATRRIRNNRLMTLHEIALMTSNSSFESTELFPWLAPACHVRFNDSSSQKNPTMLKHSEKGALIVVGISGMPVESAVVPNTTTTPTNDPLCVTITIQSSNVDACRNFAEQVRLAIQFQES